MQRVGFKGTLQEFFTHMNTIRSSFSRTGKR